MSAVDYTHQDAFATAVLDPDSPCPPGLFSWNGSDPSARMAVYRNNVITSLVDALAQSMPVVQQLVGDAFFRAMAAEFVRQNPPRSRILAHYGERLPAFIARFAPAQSVPYLADIARLELARVHAYHAPDVGQFDPERLRQALASGRPIDALGMAFQASLSVLRSRYAIHSLWVAHPGERDISTVDPYLPEDALVLRRSAEVHTIRLAPGDAVFIETLRSGASLGDAALAAADEVTNFDLSAAFSLLLSHGALASIFLTRGLDR